MKNLTYLLFLAFLSIAITSCGDDEPTLEEQIIGTWNLLSLTTSGCDDPSDNLDLDFGTSGCATIMGEELCTNATYTFTSGGAFRTGGSISAGSQILLDLSGGGTFTVEGNMVTICDEVDDECDTATVTVVDDRMTVRTTSSDDNCSGTQVYFK